MIAHPIRLDNKYVHPNVLQLPLVPFEWTIPSLELTLATSTYHRKQEWELFSCKPKEGLFVAGFRFGDRHHENLATRAVDLVHGIGLLHLFTVLTGESNSWHTSACPPHISTTAKYHRIC